MRKPGQILFKWPNSNSVAKELKWWPRIDPEYLTSGPFLGQRSGRPRAMPVAVPVTIFVVHFVDLSSLEVYAALPALWGVSLLPYLFLNQHGLPDNLTGASAQTTMGKTHLWLRWRAAADLSALWCWRWVFIRLMLGEFHRISSKLKVKPKAKLLFFWKYLSRNAEFC